MGIAGHAPRSAIARRARAFRRDPLRAFVGEADWVGTALLERLAPGDAGDDLAARYRALLYRGRKVRCPVCGSGLRYFRPAWNRPDAVCPRCLSEERHRALWLFLREHPRLLSDAGPLLHFAPEPVLDDRIRTLVPERYVSADLDPARAMDRVDIADLPYPDGSFGAVVCSHVLEHVEDDRRAMREMRRVLRRGGLALVMVPLDRSRQHTLEDPTITEPAAREAAYRQADHVRLYGRDLPERLDEAGFRTQVVRYVEGLPPAIRLRHGLNPEDEIYLARRP
jgi:SAM-dependent methyltransferase